jgi:hypothetical protein
VNPDSYNADSDTDLDPISSGSGSGYGSRVLIKNQDLDTGSGSGMNNLDHISESLETIFWVKIPKFFAADPGSGMEKIRIQ